MTTIGERNGSQVQNRVCSLTHGRPDHRWLTPAALIVIAAATVAAFAPGLGGEFLNWDDDRNFLRNDSFRGIGWDRMVWAWQTYHLGVWQPLAWLALGVQWCVGGLDARVYHLVSLVVHVANAWLFYALTFRLIRRARSDDTFDPRSAKIGAALVSGLFAVHPLRVEAVAWISAQPYLPSVFFYLLAIHAYLGAHRDGQRIGRGRPGYTLASAWFGCIAFLCFVAAVLFKAVAVSLPCVLLVLDYYPLRRIGGRAGWFSRTARRAVIEKFPYFLAAVVIATWAVQAKDYNESRAPLAEFKPSARLAQAAYGLVFYVTRSVTPVDLSPYYRLPDDVGLTQPPYALCAGGAAAAALGLYFRRRKWTAAWAACIAYGVILLPNLGLVQISQQTAADRYAYLGTMPPAALLAGGVAELLRRGRSTRWMTPAVGVAALMMGVALARASRAYVAVWHDSESLWRRVIRLDPDCAVAHCNLGEALLRRGEYGEASRHLSRAIDLEDDFAFAYTNFAVLLCRAGRFDDAASAARRALEADPPLPPADQARTHAVLGQAYAGMKQYSLAFRHTRRALEMGFGEAQKMLDLLDDVAKRGTGSASSQPTGE